MNYSQDPQEHGGMEQIVLRWAQLRKKCRVAALWCSLVLIVQIVLQASPSAVLLEYG